MTILPVLTTIVETLTRLADPWQSLYNDSTAVSVAVVFVHLASLLVGGGLALATDRATFRATRGAPADRERHLSELGLTHRPVVAALGVSFLSGALLFLSDVKTYATSTVFWTKMALVALLLGNGLVMLRLERALARSDARNESPLWGRMRLSAGVSGVLWLLTLLAGTVLMSAA